MVDAQSHSRGDCVVLQLPRRREGCRKQRTSCSRNCCEVTHSFCRANPAGWHDHRGISQRHKWNDLLRTTSPLGPNQLDRMCIMLQAGALHILEALSRQSVRTPEYHSASLWDAFADSHTPPTRRMASASSPS